MRKKLWSVILTAALAVGTLAGCGQTGTIATDSGTTSETEANTDAEAASDTTADTAKSDEQAAADTTEAKDYGTLYVSFPTGNIRIAIDILAQQLGYFKEEGVTVEEVNLGGMDALTAINSADGNLDILTTGFVADLQAIGSGYDLTVIGGTAVEGGAIITKKGNADQYKDAGTILNFDAIKSAKLGLQRNEAAWVITRQYLLDNGVAEDEIKAIEDEATGNIAYYADQTAVAQAVQKDEVNLAFLPLEYALLYADAYDLEVVAKAGDLQENYVCCREVTSKARLADKKDAFVAYEKARIRAFEYYKQGETDDSVRQDVVNIVASWSGKETDYVDTYLYGGVTKYATDPNTAGIVKYVEAANNSGLLQSVGIDFSTYDIKQNVDSSVYGQAITELADANPDNTFYASLLEQFNQDN
jgi:NitT/TauT family transport system substrate-binding protein